MKALAFGEVLWDIIDGNPHLGGAPLNFAGHMAQCGAKSYILSRVGDDNLGKSAIARIKENKVNTDLTQIDPIHETGTVKVTLSDGQPQYEIKENVAYDFIEYNDQVKSFNEVNFDLFYFGSLAQRNAVSAQTLYTLLDGNDFPDVFFDVNLRKDGFNSAILSRSLQYASILKLNTAELPVISNLVFEDNLSHEDFCKRITEKFKIRIIIITAAENGCYIFTNQHLSHMSGVKVEVADAVGAGDAFSAAFMYQYTKTKNAMKAASVANQIGAYVASKNGALPPYSDEIKKMLKQTRSLKS